MKNTISMYKRIGAMVLCLSLLCGVIMSTMVFPAAAAPSSVKTFAADFGDLAALVNTADWQDGAYTSKATDTTINEWVSSRFGIYSSRENRSYWTLDHLGVNSESYNEGDRWSGDCKWSIVQSGYLQYATLGYRGNGTYGGQMLRKSQTLVVKAESGALAKLKNFEASMVFNKAGNNNLGSVFISFHENYPGRVNTAGEDSKKQVSSGNEMVIVGNSNGGYQTSGDDGIILGNVATATTNNITNHTLFSSNLDNNTDYRLTVKVVGTNLTATVAKADDNTVVYTGSATIAAGEGYLSFGASNYKRWIKSVSVTELDDDGNEVDFGTNTPLPYTSFTFDPADMLSLYAYDTGSYYTFTDQTDANATAYRNYVGDRFNVYYSHQGKYVQATGIGYKLAYDGQTADFGNFNTHLYGKWLQRNAVPENGWREGMRLITSLVPKNSEGTEYSFKNFETTYNVRFEGDGSTADGGVVLGFRQQIAGKFIDGYYNMRQDQGLVFISQSGINIAAGNQIVASSTDAANDMYNHTLTATFSEKLPKEITVTVRVVNGEVTVKILNKSTGATVYETTTPIAISYDVAGAIAYGVTSKGHNLGAITLTHLDDAGNPIDIGKSTKAEKSAQAEKFQLSLTDITTYTGGHYVVDGESYTYNYINLAKLPDTAELLKSKLGFYFNHEGTYTEVEPAGNAGGTSGSGNWYLFLNKWLQRSAVQGTGERVRQINSIVPKDRNGDLMQTKNFSASFQYRFESTNGAILIGMRQKTPGKFVNNYNAMNTEQALIAIARNSIEVAGGTDITNEKFYTYNEFSTTFDSELPQEVRVDVTAIGTKVTVEICNLSGQRLYSKDYTVNYTESGYLSFGISAVTGNFAELSVVRLDDDGNAVDFTESPWSDNIYADGKLRFSADFTKLAELVTSYTSGKYNPTKTDDAINSYIRQKFLLRYEREGAMYERDYLGQSSSEFDNDGYVYDTLGNGKHTSWRIDEAGYLTYHGGTGGEMLRKAEILVPKTLSGAAVTLQNFEAEVVVHDERHGKGAVSLVFRSDSLAQVTQGYINVYGGQQLVSVGVDGNSKSGLAIGGGDQISGKNNNGPCNNVTDEVAALKDVDDYKLTVRALGENITVKVTSVDGKTVYFEKSTTAVLNRKGYLYLAVTNNERSIAKFTVTELDKNGNVVDFGSTTAQANTTVGDFTFSITDAIKYESSKYSSGKDYYNFTGLYGDAKTDDASTLINLLDNKFAIYYNSEGKYCQMEAGVKSAYAGQTGDYAYYGAVYANKWLQRMTENRGGTQIFRLVTSLVPRNSVTGEELTFKNFETTFEARFENADAEKSAVLFGFRQQEPGKFADTYWVLNKEQAFVSITRDGITIAGGEDITANRTVTETGSHQPGEGDMYNAQQTKTFSSNLPQDIKVYVKAVGKDVTVKVTGLDGSTTYFDQTVTVNYEKTGYIAYGTGSTKGCLNNIKLSRLDDEGNRIDINGEGTVGCDWDTTPTRYSQLVSSTTTPVEDAFTDVYYHSIKDEKPICEKETLDKHWALNTDTGVLMRKNDLSDSATGNTSMIAMTTDEGKVKLDNFDAIFKLRLDDSKNGTFWVTARQSEEANCGKVVTTPGDTDYVTGQVAVGLSVGGKITIATGDGTAVELTGPTAGTPSGDYTLRVKLSGNTVTVYLNGVARGSRTVKVNGEGYLCFGYSGAEQGLLSVQVTRLNDYGVGVDLSTTYTGTQYLTPISVTVGADIASLDLPTKLNINKGNSTTSSEVFWDLSGLDLNTDGTYNVIGYLKSTNGIRAVQQVIVGSYDSENTVKYTFDTVDDLEDFDTYFLPEAQTFNNPAIYVKGTENDTFTVSGGKLKYANSQLRFTDSELVAGKDLGGSHWQDTTSWRSYSTNFGIAVLKTQKYTNFILDMDFTSSGRWTQVGFGAEGGADGVYGSQIKGGYTFHVEYSGGSGVANIIQYNESTGKHGNNPRAKAFPVFNSGAHHYRIIVSDGVGYFFLDDNEDPWVIELGDKYEGGYIYLGLNDASHTIDNLKIVDLDAKDIELTTVKTQVSDISIDRSKGESITEMPQVLTAADADGHEYPIMASWTNDQYRSYKDGTFEFVTTFAPFHGMKTDSLTPARLTVSNSINGDFDASVSRKYYFDHENDLLDFNAYYSQQQEKAGFWKNNEASTDYWTGYDGDLVKADAATDKWKISNGKLQTNYSLNNGGYNGAAYTKGVSTLILNAEGQDMNLMNFRIEADFKQGSTFWYNAILVGVNDPTKFIVKVNQGVNAQPGGSDTSPKYMEDSGAGVYVHLEQEGYVNFRGGIESNVQRITEDLTTNSTFIAKYDKTIEHHMVVDVIDGVIMFQIDNSDVFVAELAGASLGGFMGLSAYGNGGTFDNLKVTALNEDGREVPFSEAKRGFAPEAVPDTYLGWQPGGYSWTFKWDATKYED